MIWSDWEFVAASRFTFATGFEIIFEFDCTFEEGIAAVLIGAEDDEERVEMAATSASIVFLSVRLAVLSSTGTCGRREEDVVVSSAQDSSLVSTCRFPDCISISTPVSAVAFLSAEYASAPSARDALFGRCGKPEVARYTSGVPSIGSCASDSDSASASASICITDSASDAIVGKSPSADDPIVGFGVDGFAGAGPNIETRSETTLWSAVDSIVIGIVEREGGEAGRTDG